MSDLKICTNRHWRDLLRWYDLTPKEQAEFDWLDTEERQDEAEFVRYRGWVYCMDQFERIAPQQLSLQDWHGQHGDSFFSGVLIKISKDGEQVMLATYTC